MATTAREWKKKAPTGNAEIILPSGNECLVRRLAPEAFLSSGLIPDSLSAIVNKAIKTKKGLPPDVAKAMTSDPQQLRKGLQMIDQVLCYVVMDPIVRMPPPCEIRINDSMCGQYETDEIHTEREHDNFHLAVIGEREDEVLYADQVDMEDKNFIFQFVLGGTANVEQFRKELATGMADVSHRKAVSHSAKRPPRRK